MAHSEQARDDGEPYIAHPRRVVETIKQVGVTDEDAICAAWLHDVVEDTEWNLDHIADLFNDAVAFMVDSLTLHLPRYPRDFPHHLRSELKMLALKGKTFTMPTQAKIIKIADRIDNLRSAEGNWKPQRLARYAKQAEGLFDAIDVTTHAADAWHAQVHALLEEARPIAHTLAEGQSLAEAH